MKKSSFLSLVIAATLPLMATTYAIEPQAKTEVLNSLPTQTSMSELYAVGSKQSRKCSWCRRIT